MNANAIGIFHGISNGQDGLDDVAVRDAHQGSSPLSRRLGVGHDHAQSLTGVQHSTRTEELFEFDRVERVVAYEKVSVVRILAVQKSHHSGVRLPSAISTVNRFQFHLLIFVILFFSLKVTSLNVDILMIFYRYLESNFKSSPCTCRHHHLHCGNINVLEEGLAIQIGPDQTTSLIDLFHSYFDLPRQPTCRSCRCDNWPACCKPRRRVTRWRAQECRPRTALRLVQYAIVSKSMGIIASIFGVTHQCTEPELRA